MNSKLKRYGFIAIVPDAAQRYLRDESRTC
jgi:hypothetical protein